MPSSGVRQLARTLPMHAYARGPGTTPRRHATARSPRRAHGNSGGGTCTTSRRARPRQPDKSAGVLRAKSARSAAGAASVRRATRCASAQARAPRRALPLPAPPPCGPRTRPCPAPRAYRIAMAASLPPSSPQLPSKRPSTASRAPWPCPKVGRRRGRGRWGEGAENGRGVGCAFAVSIPSRGKRPGRRARGSERRRRRP